MSNVSYLIDVQAKSHLSLTLTMLYSLESLNKTIDLEIGRKYTISYLQCRSLVTITGYLREVTKLLTSDGTSDCGCGSTGCSGCPSVNSCGAPYISGTICNACPSCGGSGDSDISDYILTIDGSTEGQCNVVTIKTSQIRNIEEYIKYADEPMEITNATANGGQTIGNIINATVKDIIIDEEGKIKGGSITDGTVTEETETSSGIVTGDNPLGNPITLMYAIITGGTIVSGDILTGRGEKNENGTYNLYDIIVVNSVIVGGKTTDETGTIIEPIIKNAIVYGGVTTGKDMISAGGVTYGDITYNATITGGITTGGTAKGEINGIPVIMKGDYMISKGGTTSGATLTGGTIVSQGSLTRMKIIEGHTVLPGAHIHIPTGEEVIKNNIISGGTATGGITTGAIVSGGIISPIPVDVVNPGVKVDTMDVSDDTVSSYKKPDGLIIALTNEGIKSNLNIEEDRIVPDITNPPLPEEYREK